ncbi:MULTISPECIES: F0F1 ATP synthase subunit epsilon [Methylomonas]|uniref:F0F1 ATP synthase subunit epsilon n=1 Tax=Methylomonas TaxID=416 RepID=UPI001232D52C|nr:F0F1 ATP synthase subunit epsilon [Methylomonas rhizoryzae]
MKTFCLDLLDSHGSARFEDVRQFIGADAGGSFGLLADHVPCVAVLRYGLARFQEANGAWHYLTMPGGVLRFADNRLTVTAVRYFLGDDPDLLCERLAEEMTRADSDIHAARATLSEIERSLMRRLAELTSHAAGGL